MTPAQVTDCSKLLVLTNKQILHCALTLDKNPSQQRDSLKYHTQGQVSDTMSEQFPMQSLGKMESLFCFYFWCDCLQSPLSWPLPHNLDREYHSTVMTQPKVPVQLQCVQPSFSVLLSRSVQHSRRKCSAGLCWGQNSGEAHLFNTHKSLGSIFRTTKV